MFFSWCDWQINYDLLNFNLFGRPVFSHLGEILNAVRSCFTWAHVKKEFLLYLYTKIFNAMSGIHQHIFKIRLQYRRTWFSSRIPPNIRLDEDVFKTFWGRLQHVLQRYFQDVFKTYHQLSLLTRLLASG